VSAASLVFDQWNVQAYETMAATARLYAAVNRQARAIRIAPRCWEVARRLREFIRMTDEIDGAPLALEDREAFSHAVHQLTEIARLIDRLLDSTARREMTNSTLLNASLEDIKKYGREIVDLAESWELGLRPETADEIAKARQESERGETIGLDEFLNSLR
jgi:hypothetical protein